MSVDTNGILLGSPTIPEIVRVLRFGYGATCCKTRSVLEDYDVITFKQRRAAPTGPEGRILHVFMNGNGRSDYAHVHAGPCTYVSFGCWGESVKIMRVLVRHFGGFLLENDAARPNVWEPIPASAHQRAAALAREARRRRRLDGRRAFSQH